MQYGLNINGYEKETKKVKKTKENFITKLSIKNIIIIFFTGLLLGRVSLFLNQSDNKGIAPFGIAYLIAVLSSENRKNTISASIGVALGYLTINNLITDGYMYMATAMIIMLFGIMFVSNKKKELMCFLLVFASFFIYGLLINNYEVGANATLCIIETVIIIPIYYVIKYAYATIGELGNKYYFTSEEMVSVSILLCLVIAGIGSINILDYSVKNVLALALVLAVAYIGGAAYGAMVGVCMGIILGVASNDMIWCVGFFSVGGLIVGIFKETGKIFSVIAGIIIYFALGLYSNDLTLKFGIEVLASSFLFICIPQFMYNKFEIEMSNSDKKSNVNNGQINSIREEFTLKLNELTNVLSDVSRCLQVNDDNKNLLIGARGSEIIENLADRCCSKCENREACWERNFNQMYNSFQLLIESNEKGSLTMPKALEKKCVQSFTVLRNAEEVINNYRVNEAIKRRLEEGRLVLSEHIDNISTTLGSLLDNFKKNVLIDSDTEKRIKRKLNKTDVEYKDLFCYMNMDGKRKIKIIMDSGHDTEYCNKNIVPIINKVLSDKYSVSEEYNDESNNVGEATFTIEQVPKYSVLSYSASQSKDGECENGDSYSFEKVENSSYMTILSDGMGSGPEASNQSKVTVDLVEKFIESGFDESCTVNTVNSIIGMRFAEDEKYATLDMSKIDLYNGNASFIKIGAAPSFIKRGNEVKVINSKNLPFGLVDEVEVESIKEKLKPGDILVSVSDGILDIGKGDADKMNWLEEYLKVISDGPKGLSESILKKAKELSKGTVKDDMTVLVSKVYLEDQI